MAKVIIFGTRGTAEQAHVYLSHDSAHEVVAFCINQEYKDTEYYRDLPVVAFEDVEKIYPVDEYEFFAPMQATNMNKNRESVYNLIKNKGYSLISYISSHAIVSPGVVIGDNCFILEGCVIEPFSSIGSNVVIWSGTLIGHHGVIKDHVFMANNVTLGGRCLIESYCYLGISSAIRDRTKLATGTLVGMAACVLKDTEEWGVYIGSPARKLPKPSYGVM